MSHCVNHIQVCRALGGFGALSCWLSILSFCVIVSNLPQRLSCYQSSKHWAEMRDERVIEYWLILQYLLSCCVCVYTRDKWICGMYSGTLHNPDNVHTTVHVWIFTLVHVIIKTMLMHIYTHRQLIHTASLEKTEEGWVDQMEQPASCWASLTTAEQLEVCWSGRPQTHTHCT